MTKKERIKDNQWLARIPDNINRVERLSKSDVLHLFKIYQFKDECGNHLLSCYDFIHLLDMAFPLEPPLKAKYPYRILSEED